MKFVLQRCCTTPIFLKQYESSTNAVLKKLGVGLVEIKELNCCGYPLRNFNFNAYILSSAGNLAMAEKENLNIMTVCNCCYGSLKHVDHLMKEDTSIKKETNKSLAKERLKYDGGIEVKHLLEVLYKDIGIEQMREKIVKTFKGLKIAVHYGCQRVEVSIDMGSYDVSVNPLWVFLFSLFYVFFFPHSWIHPPFPFGPRECQSYPTGCKSGVLASGSERVLECWVQKRKKI